MNPLQRLLRFQPRVRPLPRPVPQPSIPTAPNVPGSSPIKGGGEREQVMPEPLERIRTARNVFKFGLIQEYIGQPTHIPDDNIAAEDLSDKHDENFHRGSHHVKARQPSAWSIGRATGLGKVLRIPRSSLARCCWPMISIWTT